MRVPLLAALAALLAGCVLAPADPQYPDDAAPPADPEAPPASPYAGLQMRELKALPPEEVDGYRRGAGLGYALPAELNSYPGPLHALELADRLSLTQDQRDELTRLRAEMLARAMPLGERYLVLESAIEQGFRDGALDEEQLRALLAESASVEAELRFVHLATHLATKEVLTPHQVALYDEARGYGKADHTSHAH